MEYREFSAKTLDDAIMEAKIKLEATSENLDYDVIDKGSSGFLGIGSRPAKIRARRTLNAREKAEEFLSRVFEAMQIQVNVDITENPDEKIMNIDLSGEDMGVLIGKRGQTLDSVQYLTSLVVNKECDGYVRVKLDTENYRERRKATLESLAKNIAYKVKRTRRSVSLEPMNPYERRIIHAALQNDRYVVTRSEGEDPFRHVVISLKREGRERDRRDGRRGQGHSQNQEKEQTVSE